MKPFLPKPGSIWRYKNTYKDQFLFVLIIKSSIKSIEAIRVHSYDNSVSIREYPYYGSHSNLYEWKSDWEQITNSE